VIHISLAINVLQCLMVGVKNELTLDQIVFSASHTFNALKLKQRRVLVHKLSTFAPLH
jgi:hypothetical protein